MQDEVSSLRAEVVRARRLARVAVAVACVACAAALLVPIVLRPGATIELRGAEGVTRIGPGTLELEHGEGRVVVGTAPLPHMTFELGGQPWIAMHVSRLADPDRATPRGSVLVRSLDDDALLEPDE